MKPQVRALDDPAWLGLVSSSPDATPFHAPQWAGLIAETYGFDSFAVTFDSPAGSIAGIPVVVPKRPLSSTRWVSLPFTDSCPPLLRSPGDLSTTAAVTDAARQFARERGIDVWEIREELPTSRGVHTMTRGVNHVTELPLQEADLSAQLSKMHRRNVKTATKAGVVVERGCTEDLMDAFFRLHCVTRSRLGVPVQPRNYFRLLREKLLVPGLGWISVARLGDTPVAAAVFLATDRVIVYKYGASDRAYQQHRPNHLLFWDALCEGIARGATTFDWGRSDIEGKGLRDFKSGWGAKESPLVYSYLSDTPPQESSGRALRMAEEVIRHSPTFVARLSGEILYRWSA